MLEKEGVGEFIIHSFFGLIIFIVLFWKGFDNINLELAIYVIFPLIFWIIFLWKKTLKK